MKHEPAAFSWKHDRKRSIEIYARWAEQAWAEEVGRCPEMPSDGDYHLGFRDGFVDYVWAGGNGEPPPVPPRQFWNAMLRSPDGKRQADLWFEGYRHGARVARIGGYRELGTIRSSLFGQARDSNGMSYPTDVSAPSVDDTHFPTPVDEGLPEPPPAQSFPETSTPLSAPTRFVSRADTNKLSAMSASPEQSTRPIDKQPAALEALGLALLPTDQPTATPGAIRTKPDADRPEANAPTTFVPPHAQLWPQNSRQGVASRGTEPIANVANSTSPTTTAAAAPRTPENVAYAAQSVREIALQKAPTRGPVIRAMHVEPVVDEPKLHRSSRGDETNKRPDPATQNSPEVTTKAMVKKLPVVEAALAAIPTESKTRQTTDHEVRLQLTGDLPEQKSVSIVKLIDSPFREAPSERSPSAEPTPSPQISITECDDPHVERIVISGSLTANSPRATTSQSATAKSTIKIYSSSGDDRPPATQGQVPTLRIVAP